MPREHPTGRKRHRFHDGLLVLQIETVTQTAYGEAEPEGFVEEYKWRDATVEDVTIVDRDAQMEAMQRQLEEQERIVYRLKSQIRELEGEGDSVEKDPFGLN